MDNLQDSFRSESVVPSTTDSNTAAMEAAKKEKYNRLFQRGCIWLGIGVVTMAISFGINFVLFQEDKSFVTIMYVLTSVGAVCILKGLVDIIGF